MATMQAVTLTAITDLPSITAREVERPIPGDTQVVLKMIAAGINPMDWESASGPHAWVDAFPHTLGNEGTGTVVEIGADVTGVRLGDTVLAYNFGGSPGMFAQYNAVEAAQITVLPPGLNATDWAASPIGILSVYHAFYKRGLPAPGTSILIEGTGGVGTFAIQWAKKLGWRVAVLATARSRNWASELGADCVLTADTAAPELAEKVADFVPAGFDLVFTTLGKTALPRLTGFLAKNGRFISTMPIESPAGQELSDYAQVRGASMNAVFKQQSWEWFLAEPNGKDMAFMLNEAQRLGIRCPVAHRFPLAQTSAALVQAAHGGNRGKVVVTLT